MDYKFAGISEGVEYLIICRAGQYSWQGLFDFTGYRGSVLFDSEEEARTDAIETLCDVVLEVYA